MKFYDEINKNLIFVFPDRKFFSNLPKFFGHPIANDGYILQIIDIGLDIDYLFAKKPRKPELSPRSPLLILIDQSQG